MAASRHALGTLRKGLLYFSFKNEPLPCWVRLQQMLPRGLGSLDLDEMRQRNGPSGCG